MISDFTSPVLPGPKPSPHPSPSRVHSDSIPLHNKNHCIFTWSYQVMNPHYLSCSLFRFPCIAISIPCNNLSYSCSGAWRLNHPWRHELMPTAPSSHTYCSGKPETRSPCIEHQAREIFYPLADIFFTSGEPFPSTSGPPGQEKRRRAVA